MTEADYIAQRIAEIRRQHEAELKPFNDRLVLLRAMEPPSQLALMAAEVERLAQVGASIAMRECLHDQPDGTLVFRRPSPFAGTQQKAAELDKQAPG